MSEAAEQIASMTGPEKAAILLLSLDEETASLLLQKLDSKSVESLTRQVATLSSVEPQMRNMIVREYYDLAMAKTWAAEGGLDYAKSLLKRSCDPKVADQIIQQIAQSVHHTPFAFLQKAESDHVLTFIQDEHPQTIALIVSHLPYHKAAEILGALPAQKQIEVVKRIANMEQTNPEVIREVEDGLESRLSTHALAVAWRRPAASTPSPRCSTSSTARPRRASWRASSPKTRTWSNRSGA